MEKKKPHNFKWTKELCQKEANKYTTRGEFQKNSGGAYSACLKKGWLNEVCYHMKEKIDYTKELCQKEANKYTTRGEFAKNSSGAYNACRRNGWLVEVCYHMKEKIDYTKELCQKEANKYTTRGEFAKNSGSAYNACCRNGWLVEVCFHMEEKIDYTKELCQKEANKYTTRGEFAKNSSGAYNACVKKGWLNEVCYHMKEKIDYTKELCQKEANKYTTRNEFKKGSPKAYDACCRNGWLNEICGHMEKLLFYKLDFLELLNRLKDSLPYLSIRDLVRVLCNDDDCFGMRYHFDKFKVFERLKNVKIGKERLEILNQIENEILNTTEEKFNNEELLDISNDETETVLINPENLLIEEEENNFIKESVLLLTLDETRSGLSETTIRGICNDYLQTFWQREINETFDNLNNEFFEIKQSENYENTILCDLLNEFEMQRELVYNLSIPDRYIGKIKPNLMQKLVCYMVGKQKRLGNWSQTGAGKTLSAIFTSVYIDAKITMIVTNNNTINNWIKNIEQSFVDKTYNIIKKYKNDKINLDNINPELYNYIVINYETFSNPENEEKFKKLTDEYIIDFIVLDEVQSVKQTSNSIETNRTELVKKVLTNASNKNENIHVLGMSATPIVNNLVEGKNLLELIIGKEFPYIKVIKNLNNCISLNTEMVNHGIRLKFNTGINVKNTNVDIKLNDNEVITKLNQITDKNNRAEQDSILNVVKIKYLLETGQIKKGTIIYSWYVETLPEIARLIQETTGLSVKLFTGETFDDDRNNLIKWCDYHKKLRDTTNEVEKLKIQRFLNDKNNICDVIIASDPISTGVDCLQYVFNKLIFISPPFTSAKVDQIIGRIDRQGSFFNEIEIIKVEIPELEIERRRWEIVEIKRIMLNVVADAILPENFNYSHNELLEMAERKTNGDINIGKYGNDIFVPYNTEFEIENRSEYVKTEFNKLNQKWGVSNSSTTFERLQRDKSEWEKYHELYGEARKNWIEIPYIQIAKKITNEKEIVVDMGCGENLLSKEIPNNIVHGFDYIAIDESVSACDMSNTGLKDNSVDVVVFSLSLMGRNYEDYIKESYRILHNKSWVYIADVKSNWERDSGSIEDLRNCFIKYGFINFREDDRTTDKFIYMDFMKKI